MNDLHAYRESVIQLSFDFAKSFILHTAFELDLFETIGKESYPKADLAETLHVDPEALGTFLNALVSLELLEFEIDAYSLSSVGQAIFLKENPHYVGDMVKLQSFSVAGWLQLKQVIVDRHPPEVDVHQFGDLQDLMDTFTNAMSNAAMSHANVLADQLPVKSARTLLDLGCGPGTYSSHLLQAHPELRATLFDRTEVLHTAREKLAADGVRDRANFIEGDFLETEIVDTYDACLASHIIHEYDAETNIGLFAKVFDALHPNGTLFVQDFFLDDSRQSPEFATIFSLQMLLTAEQGACYTITETTRWLSEAGFEDIEVLELDLPRATRIVQATKP